MYFLFNDAFHHVFSSNAGLLVLNSTFSSLRSSYLIVAHTHSIQFDIVEIVVTLSIRPFSSYFVFFLDMLNISMIISRLGNDGISVIKARYSRPCLLLV